MKTKWYTVCISYPADWYFSEENEHFKLDNKIKRLNRKAQSGTGFGFGKRDVAFDNLSRGAADKLMTQARKIKKGVTARIYLQDEKFE